MLSLLDAPVAPAVRATEPFILLVDDHESCLHQLRQLVELVGHTCVPANSAFDALVYCDAHPPRAVVTDLVMPQLDGQALARWLKARYPNVPIILLTGQQLDELDGGELEKNFAAVLQKPLDVEKFLGLLQQLMLPDAAPAETDVGRP
jgi:CheY-like chemotaxis protein